MSQACFSKRFHMTLSSASSNMLDEILLAFQFCGVVWDKIQTFRKSPEIFKFYSLVTSDIVFATCILPSYIVLPKHTKQLHNHEKRCCSKVCQKFAGTPNLPTRERG